MPSLVVEQFGPVARADLELRPLTVLIGPNNSGKSYIAKLVYALHTATSSWGTPGQPIRDDFVNQLEAFERTLPRRHFNDLPKVQRELYEAARRIAADQRQDRLRWALWTYFGFDFGALVNRSGGHQSFLVEYRGSDVDPFRLRVQLGSENQDLNCQLEFPRLDEAVVPSLDNIGTTVKSESGDVAQQLVRWVWGEVLRLGGLHDGPVYYLPSGRSGLLAGAQVIAGAAISLVAQRAGLERIELGPLTGVEGDFVRTVVQGISSNTNLLLRQGWSHELAEALQLLETDILHGVVVMRSSGSGRPLILYQRENLELPMAQSSSMVAELAPVALWLKAFLQHGDLLIVDEPESHLHPENQRLIARVIARLVNAGVRVICTTHSSLILHQISNCMMASRADEAELQTLGLTRRDVLPFESVAAYLFEAADHGTRVSQVDVDAEFGLSEEEFIRVAEEIGEETYNLKVAAMDNHLVHAGSD